MCLSAMTMPRSLCEILITAQATLSMYFWQANEGLARLDLLPSLDAICQRKAFGLKDLPRHNQPAGPHDGIARAGQNIGVHVDHAGTT